MLWTLISPVIISWPSKMMMATSWQICNQVFRNRCVHHECDDANLDVQMICNVGIAVHWPQLALNDACYRESGVESRNSACFNWSRYIGSATSRRQKVVYWNVGLSTPATAKQSPAVGDVDSHTDSKVRRASPRQETRWNNEAHLKRIVVSH